MNKMKIMSLAIVLAMLVSAFGMIMPAVSADIVNVTNGDGRNIMYTDTNLDDNPVYIGEQGVTFWIDVYNGWDTTGEDLYFANLTIATTVRTETGTTVSPSPIDSWVSRSALDQATLWDSAMWDTTFGGFEFDVEPDATPGTYNLTVSLTYNTLTENDLTYTGYILFDIAYRGDVGDMPILKPGDLDKAINIQVISDWDGDSDMYDVFLNITIPDTDFSWFGLAVGTASAYHSDIAAWSDWENFPYTISVNKNKDSGTYVGSYVLEYTTFDGIMCVEEGSMDFEVRDLAMLSATIETDTIAQGTVTTTMVLTFTNTGTVDLLNVKVFIDANSNDFFFTVADHWEGAGTVSYAWIELGNMVIGATVTANMDVGIDLYIPEGQHKLLFGFEAKYLDPDTMTYKDTSAGWVWDAIEHVPWVDMDGATFVLNPDTSTVEGTFVWITVTDTVMDVRLTSIVTLTTGGRILDNALTLSVQNPGNIDFTNVVLQIETNTEDSPFINVVDSEATLSEEAPLTNTLWAGTTDNVNVQVNLLPGTEMGVYMIPVTINAVNMDMGEVITQVVNARITIRGVGPQIEVASVSPETIKPGEAFTLTLVLTNVGDDTARNFVISSWHNDQQTSVDGNYAVPVADALPLFVGDIAPGASLTVTIPMRANSDISEGHVYLMDFEIDYVDSFGNGPTTDWISASVMSTGNGGSVVGTYFITLSILAIVASIFLIIVAIIIVIRYRKPKAAAAVEDFPEYQEFQAPPPPENDMVEP